MIDAKNKFREGFILILRPFKFAEDIVIQKHTIVWAYSERPLIKEVLNEKGIEELDQLENTTPPFVFRSGGELKDFQNKWKDEEMGKILKQVKNYDQLYEGEIVQATIDGILCKFYPDEYSILSIEKIHDLMEEEGYHAIISPTLKSIKPFREGVHYLTSRGIEERIANKWVSAMYKDLVYYKPYYELLKMFCRDIEIIPDKFYEEVEGIKF